MKERRKGSKREKGKESEKERNRKKKRQEGGRKKSRKEELFSQNVTKECSFYVLILKAEMKDRNFYHDIKGCN